MSPSRLSPGTSPFLQRNSPASMEAGLFFCHGAGRTAFPVRLRTAKALREKKLPSGPEPADTHKKRARPPQGPCPTVKKP
ncbi:hypothetical protein DESPIG_02782 [Desulfovibrio piger ATCC 29098]|uniref:Uncharacterized protein n=1 Tax=Desulfovibrio piger ATCC 29098 TaxID=411464 RepID=B6WXF6_9BACT|nr:hypothetical protein DESPIG_02782 [Desulfovibrio piger ATCC 29098]